MENWRFLRRRFSEEGGGRGNRGVGVLQRGFIKGMIQT